MENIITFQRKKNDKNNLNILLRFISLLTIINTYVSQCSKDKPFFKEKSCQSTCTSEELKSEKCIISNGIIKVQWLNNIIYFGEMSYNYINIETSENDDLLAEVSYYPKTNNRYFYGLTKEGKGFFKRNNEVTAFYKIELKDPNNKGRFESEIFSFKLDSSKDDKIYLLSLSKGDQYVEIYDFYNDNSYFVTNDIPFERLYNIHQLVSPHFKLRNKNNNNYFLGLLTTEYKEGEENTKDSDYFYLRKVKFNSLDINNTFPVIYNKTRVKCSTSLIVSCFETILEYIVCFYKSINNDYTIIVFNVNLEEKANLTLSNNSNDFIFFKCIHFYDEIGVFAYHLNDETKSVINFLFKKYDNYNNSIVDFDSSVKNILIEGYSFYKNLTFNDMVKIIDKKFYYVVISNNRKILYIFAIYNYYGNQFSQRIYKINTYDLNNYIFLNSIRITIYKNFLSLYSNFNIGENGSIFSSIMILSYPNSTNINVNLINYLLENNDITINNLVFELKNECYMENNIFGYVYSGIQIIENCNEEKDIYLTSLSDEKIINDYYLQEGEQIKLFVPKKSVYDLFVCKFRYACVVSEPEFENYNQYPDKYIDTGIDSLNNNEKIYFEDIKTNYIGKYSFYNISLEDKLKDNCENNHCEICYEDESNKCITCKYDYNIVNNQYKICYCLFNDIINNECKEDVSLSQINQVNSYFEKELNNKNYTGENIIIETGNAAFQLCKVDEQKSQNNNSISNVDLGECEIKLKNENNIFKKYINFL